MNKMNDKKFIQISKEVVKDIINQINNEKSYKIILQDYRKYIPPRSLFNHHTLSPTTLKFYHDCKICLDLLGKITIIFDKQKYKITSIEQLDKIILNQK